MSGLEKGYRSGFEKGYDTNHKMNFIIGFFVSVVINTLLWVFEPSFGIERISFEIFLFIALIFGIPGGIISIIVGLAIDFKKYNLIINMIIGAFVGTTFIVSAFVGGFIFIDAIFYYYLENYLIFLLIIATIIDLSVVLMTSRAYKNDTEKKMNLTTSVPTPKPNIKLEPLYESPIKPIEEKQIDTPVIEKQETKSPNNIVQHIHNYGDNIGTQVKDSLLQRSNIGTDTDVIKCPNCNRDVDANEKFCLECGTKIE